jgi:GNAT superfamily N-acetyltransferase
METRRLTGDDWQLLRDVRLAALADAPHAYGSTLAREQGFDEAEWRQRLTTGLWVTATENVSFAGLVGVYLPKPDTPMLIAMWVSPDHRGRGVGDALITEIVRWVTENRWSRLVLRVADSNDAARRLFLRHGFTPTGHREPLESNPQEGTETLSLAI